MNEIFYSKKKLIISILIVVCCFILSLAFSFILINDKLNSQKDYFKVNKARVITNSTMLIIDKNYPNIDSTDLKSELKKISSHLKIINLYGRAIYDSKLKSTFHKNFRININSNLQYDAYFESQHPNLIRLTFPVIKNEKQIANAVFDIPSHLLIKKTSLYDIAVMLLPVILFVLFFILSFIYYTFKISSDIFKPLNSLIKASTEISKGNLNFKINYRNNTAVGTLCIVFNNMMKKLKQASAMQAEYENSRKELIASISHDLKTPIASIKVYVDGLIDGMAKTPQSKQKYLKVIKNKTDSLIKLVDDLFNHSLKDAGKFNINLSEHYSKNVIENILDAIVLEFKNEPLIFNFDPNIPNVLIKVDPSRIEQVIFNLIQNSKKYTQKGGTINFSCFVEGNFLKILIKDSGIGISNEDIPHIFESFYRGEKARSSSLGGSGLGLSICKYIIEAHGGQIFVSSKLNMGSSFLFTIPLL